MLESSDEALVLYLARCTLAKKAGRNNWVEEEAVDGLPEYICRIARAIHRDGSHSVSQSIAIAVSRVKAWARGADGVTAKTRIKAAKAVAEWEKKKAAAKLDNKVKASAHILDVSNLDTSLTTEQLEKAALIPCTEKYNMSLLETVALSEHLKLEEAELLKLSTNVLNLAARTFPAKSRSKLASSGSAMSDGSYPIPDKDALRRAIQSFGRAKESDRAKVKAHIMRRARALGAIDMIPESWKR